jgi:FG-GAP repeat
VDRNVVGIVVFGALVVMLLLVNPVAAEQKLWASDPWGWNVFGYAAAIDGDTAVVGSYAYDELGPPTVSDVGSAYIFQWNDVTGAWVEVAQLFASDAAEGDFFAIDVAISGDIVVVGAYGDDHSVDDGGSVYVFYRDQGGPGAWGEVAKLVASDAGLEDRFGSSVDLEGSTVVVGAPFADGAGSDRGKAYVFEKDAGGLDNWGEVKILTASDAADGARFGYSATVGGDTVVVGAFLDPEGGVDSGAAYVFDRDQGGVGLWGQVTKLTATDAAAGARFGFSASIDADLVVIGADRDSGTVNEGGAAYLFDRNLGGPDAWGERTKLVPSDAAAEDNAGSTVGIFGDFIVVGSGYHDAVADDAGAAYVYSRNTGGPDTWGEYQKIVASDGVLGDRFGHKGVAVGRDWMVVGAYRVDGGTPTTPECGAAYVFYIPIFADGFESGTTDSWSAVTQ